MLAKALSLFWKLALVFFQGFVTIFQYTEQEGKKKEIDIKNLLCSLFLLQLLYCD